MHNDLLIGLIMKMDAFMTKKGVDRTLTKELINSINEVTKDTKLQKIEINDRDDIRVPLVAVVPHYYEDFHGSATNSDLTSAVCAGYTIEFCSNKFSKYTSEEVVAVTLHNILQNVESSVAKSRFLSAYSTVRYTQRRSSMDDYYKTPWCDAKERTQDELSYLLYLDICLRPFEVPITKSSIIGTDDVLRSMKLDDAYNSALRKMRGKEWFTYDPSDIILKQKEGDEKVVKNIINAELNGEINGLMDTIRKHVPINYLSKVIMVNSDGHVTGLFASKCKKETNINDSGKSLTESIFSPKNEIEIRYQIDKILTDMRFMEHEDERMAVLYRTRNLTKTIAKTKVTVQKKLTKTPDDRNLSYKLQYLSSFLDELEEIRGKIVNQELKPTKYGVIIKYPAGYEY